MQESFWWWQCSDRYIVSLSPHLHAPFPPFSPSLISLMVSVDVKHHVYLLTNVVRALVRSRLSYGLEAMPHLSKTGLARFTAIEVPGLRLALGLPQSVPQCLVYREAGLLPFRRHIQLVCSKYVFRCQTVDNSTVDEITATFRKPSRLQSYSSISDLVCDLVRSAGLDGVEVATRSMYPYPPWLLERAHVEVDMEGLMKDQNPLVLAVTARLCLEEKYQHHLKIFTDGSVMEDGAAGAAFVIPEFSNLTHSYSLPAVSVFTAELLAQYLDGPATLTQTNMERQRPESPLTWHASKYKVGLH